MKNEGIVGLTVMVVAWVAAIYGYVENIIKLVHMDHVLTGEGVVRIVGVFTGLIGAIAGYF